MMEPTDLTRPIIGIENRTPQEVFDIMVSRIELIATPVFHVAPDLSAEDFERIKRTAERQPMLPGTPPPSPQMTGIEQCAKIADRFAANNKGSGNPQAFAAFTVASEIAKAIRALATATEGSGDA